MQDKVALVTGAGAGSGCAIARRLARGGAAVVIADVDRDAGEETVRQQIAEAVVMFVEDETMAGRVMVWPDGEPWRLIPISSGVVGGTARAEDFGSG